MSEADIDLVGKARAGDVAAFEELVRRTSRLVFARLYLDSGDAHAAEDLVQETYLSAYRSLSNLDDPSRFRPWLLAIAQRVAIDAGRRSARLKRRNRTVGTPPLEEIVGREAAPDFEAERQEMRQHVLSQLRSLPEDYRLPLTLRYITGADAESIGIQLGLTNGALRGLLHRGLKMLRDRMEGRLEGGAS